MDAIEKRARELLAAQVRDLEVGGVMNAFDDLFVPESAAVQAIIAALTPPEGYVLVPVKLTEKMLDALYTAEGDMSDDDMDDLWNQVLAARPEVP